MLHVRIELFEIPYVALRIEIPCAALRKLAPSVGWAAAEAPTSITRQIASPAIWQSTSIQGYIYFAKCFGPEREIKKHGFWFVGENMAAG